KDDIAKAKDDLINQANPDADNADLLKRYPKAQARDFDGNPKKLTEMDALIAYLQVLGTFVDTESAAAQEALAKEKGRWGLLAMTISFVVLCAWPFRPGGRKNSDEAATMIFEEDDHVRT
ncbi:hypothetical protein E4T56_gene14876, partial [Termitomyces sp. T112]